MTTAFADERRAIEARFAAQWAAGTYASVPVAYENVDLTPPEDGSSYVALFVRSGRGNQVSLGTNPRVRFAGIIQVSVFARKNEGGVLARAMADAAATIFERSQFSSGQSGTITTLVPQVTERVGQSGTHHQVDVTVPYRRDLN